SYGQNDATIAIGYDLLIFSTRSSSVALVIFDPFSVRKRTGSLPTTSSSSIRYSGISPRETTARSKKSSQSDDPLTNPRAIAYLSSTSSFCGAAKRPRSRRLQFPGSILLLKQNSRRVVPVAILS